MIRAKKETRTDGSPAYWIYCSGCKMNHIIDSRWQHNENEERPTFHPSLLVTGEYAGKSFVCHSFITDGKMQFLSDCTHDLKDQTVEMLSWDTDEDPIYYKGDEGQ